jgi:hypothetical protein
MVAISPCLIATFLVSSCSGSTTTNTATNGATSSLVPCPTTAAAWIDYLTGQEISSGSAPWPLPATGQNPAAPQGGITRARAIQIAEQGVVVKEAVLSTTLDRYGNLLQGIGAPGNDADRWVWLVVFHGQFGLMHQACASAATP